MQTRYHQLLFIVGLSLMVGCFDSSEDSSGTASSEASSATASPQGPNLSVCDGDIITEAELSAAKNCIEITGDILLNALTGVTAVDFPVLEQVKGQVYISKIPNLKSITMPVLTTIVNYPVISSPDSVFSCTKLSFTCKVHISNIKQARCPIALLLMITSIRLNRRCQFQCHR